MILILVLFDPMRIAKLASAFQLLMFALVCLAVIVMRESRIPSYDPGYKSPLYPWMQLLGIISPFYLIFEMGALSIGFSIGLIVISSLWYRYYARGRVARTGAIYHVFERLGHHRHHDLDTELRGILREKGLREEDPFEDIVMRCLVFDLTDEATFEEVVRRVAEEMCSRVHLAHEEFMGQIMEGNRIGATPVSRGVALPHFRTERIEQTEMALVRCRKGVQMRTYDPLTHEAEEEVLIYALFFLISPDDNPTQHLRILARIAERIDEVSFPVEWDQARNERELQESLLHDDRFVVLQVKASEPTGTLVGKLLREAGIPRGCLVAVLKRDDESFVPNGRTVLQEGDELTIIGEDEGMDLMRDTYLPKG